MTTNEIKKLLYKEKPMAHLVDSDNEMTIYRAWVGKGEYDATTYVYFHIPFAEMGEAPFAEEMPAQLLNRWIKNDPPA